MHMKFKCVTHALEYPTANADFLILSHCSPAAFTGGFQRCHFYRFAPCDFFLEWVLLAAALAGPCSVSAQMQVAPVVHIDLSKLPDIEGIHLGMSVEQASAIMKSLFPAGSHTLTVTAAKFMRTSDKPWLASMTGMLANGCAGCQDQLDIRFSLPPTHNRLSPCIEAWCSDQASNL